MLSPFSSSSHVTKTDTALVPKSIHLLPKVRMQEEMLSDIADNRTVTPHLLGISSWQGKTLACEKMLRICGVTVRLSAS